MMPLFGSHLQKVILMLFQSDRKYLGHHEIVKLLLESRSNINIGAVNFKAFRDAVSNGHLNVVKILFQYEPKLHRYLSSDTLSSSPIERSIK